MLKRLDNYLDKFFVHEGEYIMYLKFIKLIDEPFDILSDSYFWVYTITYTNEVYCLGETRIKTDDFNDLLDLEEITEQEFYDAVTAFHEHTKQMALRWRN